MNVFMDQVSFFGNATKLVYMYGLYAAYYLVLYINDTNFVWPTNLFYSSEYNASKNKHM